MFFWNSLAFSMIQWMLAVWSLVPLPVRKPAWTSGSTRFRYCLSLAWRILSTTLLECEMSAIVRQFEHSLTLPFFGIGMKTDLFQSCGHCWVFQICWHTECSTFTASSFRIWNSSTGMKTSIYLREGKNSLGEKRTARRDTISGAERNNAMQCMLLSVKVPRSQTFRTAFRSSLPLCQEQL